MKQLAIVLAAWMWLCGVALADESGEDHLRRAREAETSGDYRLAQIEYIAAYMQLHDAQLFYDLARAYELGGDTKSAATYYRQYLAKIDVPPEQRRELLDKIAQLDAMPAPTPPARSAGPSPTLPSGPESAPEPDAARRPAATPGAASDPMPLPPSFAPSVDLGPRAGFANAEQVLHGTAPTRRRWRYYGWQLMLSDAATILLTIQTEEAGVFVAGYLVGPAFIHGLNGRTGWVLGSPLLRVGIPVVMGSAMARDGGEFSWVAGAFLGALLAPIIDYSWAFRSVELPGYVAVGKCEGTARCTTLGYGFSW